MLKAVMPARIRQVFVMRILTAGAWVTIGLLASQLQIRGLSQWRGFCF